MSNLLSQVAIHELDDLLVIELPYNPRMQARFREAGGKWDAVKRCWNLPAKKANYTMLKRMFNWVPGCGTKWIKVNNPHERSTKPLADDEGSEVYYKGYLLGSRKNRDRNVFVPDGVVAHGNYAASGGSAKYPDVLANSNVTAWDVVVYDGKASLMPPAGGLFSGASLAITAGRFALFSDQELIDEVERRGYLVKRDEKF